MYLEDRVTPLEVASEKSIGPISAIDPLAPSAAGKDEISPGMGAPMRRVKARKDERPKRKGRVIWQGDSKVEPLQ